MYVLYVILTKPPFAIHPLIIFFSHVQAIRPNQPLSLFVPPLRGQSSRRPRHRHPCPSHQVYRAIRCHRLKRRPRSRPAGRRSADVPLRRRVSGCHPRGQRFCERRPIREARRHDLPRRSRRFCVRALSHHPFYLCRANPSFSAPGVPGTNEYEDQQIPVFPPRLSALGKVSHLEYDGGGGRILTLEVTTFCRSVFGNDQGPISWVLKVLLDSSPRWAKFVAPKVGRSVFVSGAVRGPILAKGQTCWAISCDNASYVAEGSSPPQTPIGNDSNPGRRRIHREMAPEKPTSVDSVDLTQSQFFLSIYFILSNDTHLPSATATTAAPAATLPSPASSPADVKEPSEGRPYKGRPAPAKADDAQGERASKRQRKPSA